jgi:3'(2'), 5'-bisphosphate nucleotidase
LTEADNASHKIISEILSATGNPILSEEGKEIPFDERKKWNYYWLVDPLDGTKEFIKRNGEFTVNIALMEKDRPLAGIIYQPVKGIAFAGIEGDGLYKLLVSDKIDLIDQNKIKISGNSDKDQMRVIASRTHLSAETEQFINELRSTNRNVEIINAGSALKFCVIAEGNADIYPRFSPTMEWDTAAGHALLKSVGKNIYLHPAGIEMTYNKPQLVNDWFIAK